MNKQPATAELLRYRATVAAGELAQMSGKSEGFMRAAIARGDIAVTKRGRSVLISVEEARRFLGIPADPV